MERYKNKLFAILLSVFALVSFSSCVNDEHWISSTLDFETQVPVMPNGHFNKVIRIDQSFIKDFRGQDYLLDIRTLNSWLTISNMVRQDRATFTLVANGNISYEFLDVISPNSNGEYVIEDDGFYNFMINVIDIIRDRGYVDITIFGTSNIVDGGPLIFTFENNIDIYVRE